MGNRAVSCSSVLFSHRAVGEAARLIPLGGGLQGERCHEQDCSSSGFQTGGSSIPRRGSWPIHQFRSPGCCLTSEASGFWHRGQTESSALGTLVATLQRAWEEVFGPHHGSPILALCKVTRPPSGLPLQSPVDPLTQINYQAKRAENQTRGDQWHLKEALHLP